MSIFSYSAESGSRWCDLTRDKDLGVEAVFGVGNESSMGNRMA